MQNNRGERDDRDSLGPAVGSTLEIAVGYLDAAARCLAKGASMMADFAVFTKLHVEVARTLTLLQEATNLVLQELEQVQDDLIY